MTAKAALIKHLLSGQTINVKTCFNLIGLTNCAREISRMIEQPFQVKCTRIEQTGKSRYGQAVNWIDYRLENNNLNAAGIKLMVEYLFTQHAVEKTGFKTDKEKSLVNS